MYLWKMHLYNEEQRFKFTEHTPEIRKRRFRISDYDFETDKIYKPDDPKIKDIITSAMEMCKKLELNLKDCPVSIYRGYTRLHIMWKCGVFEICFDDGKVKAKTENGWIFTREQFNALFDFINVLIEHNWFF